ncbi:6-hydroxy-D-nicotine oxidase [Termitomyces sp. T112]|nr:6-hydroxy-D-nicotine oxidase [Termitomyces sp. T112]
MLRHYLIAGISLASYVFAHSAHSDLDLTTRFFPVCAQIEDETSSATSVFYPGDILGRYAADISHWASSSTQFAECSVRPGTAEDVAKILQIVGSTRKPFAVKGGGHASNPGFSSTNGIQISMKPFAEVTYDAESQTVVIGAGLIWDDVYAALAPYGVSVVGGRVTGVGVAGFILGGGYSWLTNQHGLTIDTVLAFELVKPNGDIVNVTEASDPNLFFGLKGGMNNFGIVTRFTLKTFPQGQVWAGSITYTFDRIPSVTAATAKFSSTVTDPKAVIITTYNFLLGQPGILQLIFYDGPEPPTGIFDDFLAIPHLTNDVSTRDFTSFVKGLPANATYGQRGIFQSVSLTEYTTTLLDAVYNETVFWGSRLSLLSGSFISYGVEPFLPTLFSHGSDSAYPPSREKGLSPFNIYFAWTSSLSDDEFHEAARQSAAQIKAVAMAEGQDISDVAIYPNYAIYDTPLEGLYGSNVPTLQALKASIDPTNVMGLAGGFRL